MAPKRAPLQRSYAGLPELPPRSVAEQRDQLTILHVRSSEDFDGPDGHAAGSLLIPLPVLEKRSGETASGRPVVVLCHSGSRSAERAQQQAVPQSLSPGQPPAQGLNSLGGLPVLPGHHRIGRVDARGFDKSSRS